MRSLFLASLAAIAIPACTQDIGGGPSGDDGTGGPSCGNGIVETGETCDDGNTVAGDGCSATCQMETSATPAIVGSMNPITVELYNPGDATLSLTAQGGFTGTANLAYSLVDANGTAIAGATVTGPTTADLSSGSASLALKVMVPLAATGTDTTGTVKVDVTSTLAPVTVAAPTTIKAIFTIDYVEGTGTTIAKHTFDGMSFTVTRGTIIRFKKDDDTAPAHIIHGDGSFPHEAITAMQPPGSVYDVQTIGTAPGSTGHLGCHDHGSATYINFTVM